MGFTAREILARADTHGPAWAKFDARWYLRAYPRVRETLPAPTEADLRDHYLEHGQRQGHSPNPFFDEAFFLRVHPGAAAAVLAGEAESGFDLYCRNEGRHRWPHWLFDEAHYRASYDDLTDEVLVSNGMVNGYDHFLQHGARELRMGSPFFDPAIYRDNQEPEAAAKAGAAAEAAGWFADFIARQHARTGTVAVTSVYFEPEWYLQAYPDVARAVAEGRVMSALHHYLTNDTPSAFDPLPEFSESFYLKLYPDIQAAIEAGDFRNGYDHFLSNGVFELRAPCEAIDLRYYLDTHRVARDDLQRGAARDAFAHYRTIGRAQGLIAAQPPEEKFTEGQAKALFRLRAQNLVPLFARHPLDFSYDGAPDVSVVMVVHDRFALTLQALGSLRGNFAGAIDLILVDSGSTDETLRIERCVRGATVLRFDSNIGFLRGSNAGLVGAGSDAVLFLNNDVELAPGAVAAALARLASDPKIGAVGGKIVRAHGRLQEAGCIVWGDGATLGYMRDAAPGAPEANFVRDVDFCSAAFLLVRAALAHELEGFAEAFAPAYYEDVDLCVRITRAGYRVVYDPSVVVHHLEYGSASSPLASEAEMSRARQIFIRRNLAYLRDRPVADPQALAAARSRDAGRRRILFIEDMVPLRIIGSGFVRSNDLIGVMAEMGFHVTIFPVLPHGFDLAAVYADIPDTVEVMHDRTLADLPAFLASRPGYYDVVWIARTHNLDRTRAVLETLDPPPRIVLDTEAIAALRTATQIELPSQGGDGQGGDCQGGDFQGGDFQRGDFDTDAAIRREFANAPFCERIVAVSEYEAAKLRAVGIGDVSVIGHMRALTPTGRSFEDRLGMLFVGAIHRTDSPNYDSLCWFVDAVLPLVESALGWETRLTIAGYTGDGVALDRFRGHPRISLRGALADTTPLYDAHRIFVAPTRFAAGTPYKLYEAASYGLPIVASDLLLRQTGWEDGVDLLSAPVTDPDLFAAHIVRLYRDKAEWQALREAALSRLWRENGREHYVRALRAVLGAVPG
jgi:GT2 family glycosyltransferase